MNGGQVGEMSDPYRNSRRPEWTGPTGTEATTARIEAIVAERLADLGIDYGVIIVPHHNTGEPMQEQVPLDYVAQSIVAALLSAGVIRDMQAAAWDEGYDARGVDIANEGLTYTTLTPNPYRAARIEEG